LLVSFQGSTEGVFHENQVHNNFCFTLQKAILVSDEKGHQSLYCLGGDQCCSECDGNRKVWAHEAYQGQSMSLEEVRPFFFFCFFFVSLLDNGFNPKREQKSLCSIVKTCVWCWRCVTSIQVKNYFYFPFFCTEKKKNTNFYFYFYFFLFLLSLAFKKSLSKRLDDPSAFNNMTHWRQEVSKDRLSHWKNVVAACEHKTEIFDAIMQQVILPIPKTTLDLLLNRMVANHRGCKGIPVILRGSAGIPWRNGPPGE